MVNTDNSLDNPNTIAAALALGKAHCAQSESPSLDAQLLLMHVLGCDRTRLMGWPEQVLTPDQDKQYRQLLKQRAAGHPVAHLTGTREFWSLPLEVNASTLIPRPETECLVEATLERACSVLENKPEVEILELGTGTGAISLALASELPDSIILATDKLDEAVALAIRNRDRLGLERIEIIQSDWFKSIPKNRTFNVIVSNPPYIDASDPHLEQGDVRFEPHTALVSGENGLADIGHIICEGVHYLNREGWMLLEHGHLQGEPVRELFRKFGYQHIHTLQDYANLDRITLAQFNLPQ